MLPIITGLIRGIAIKKGEEAVHDAFKKHLEQISNLRASQDGVQVVHTGANDGTDKAFTDTLARIAERISGHHLRKKGNNDNAHSGDTTDKIMDRHNDHTYSRGYLDRRNAHNDNVSEPNTIMPANIVDHSPAYEQTMDRIMDNHNAHGREFPAPANDDDGRAQMSMHKIRNKHMQYPNELPDPANDRRKKQKRIIHPYKPGVERGEAAKAFDEEEKKSAKGIGGVKATKLLESIEDNTFRTAETTDSINDKIAALLDDMGIDYMRDTERNIEGRQGTRPSSGNSGSSRDSEGNKKEEKKGMLESMRDFLASGVGIGTSIIGGGVASLVGNFFGGSGDGEGQAGGNNADGYRPSTDVGTADDPSPSPRDAAPPTGKKGERQAQLYEAFRNTGMTHEGAKTMVAQVGRENGFQDRYLFGNHRDPYNKEVNAGIISWQGKRGEKLVDYMKERGHVTKDGSFAKTQKSLNDQAMFLDNEMKSTPEMKAARKALFDPSKKYNSIEGLVGDDVISWRRHDPKYRAAGYRNQNDAYAQISALTDKDQGLPPKLKNAAKNGSNPLVDGINSAMNMFAEASKQAQSYQQQLKNQPHAERGKQVQQTSTKQAAEANKTTVNVNTTNVNSKGGGTQAPAPQRPKPPAANPTGYSTLGNILSKYFGS